MARPAAGGSWSPSVAADATGKQPQCETEIAGVQQGVGASCRYAETAQERLLTSSLHECVAKSEYMQPGYGAVPLPRAQWCSSVQAHWAEPPALTGEIMSGAAQEGASPAPYPSCSSMCLLFTCKMWVSPPCSNRTLKTGTPCYDSALPANIKQHISGTSTRPGTSIPQPQYN